MTGDQPETQEYGVRESALAELRDRLDAARAKAQCDQTQLAKRAQLARSTVNQALSHTAPAPSVNTLTALAKALRLDPDPLLALLRTARSTPSPAALEGWEADGGPGRPITACDPLELEVHPAAAPVARRASQPKRAGLPAYVPRPHDDRLAEIVREAKAGQSRMAVLVGTSSTGKTRACWEAIQPLAEEGWLLWHPFDPTRAEAALAGLQHVRSRTVIWLNEAQHYLGAGQGSGERLAAALTTLLQDPTHGPILILGTLWPDYAVTYTALPTPGAEDPHSQVRALLNHRRLDVPDRFDAATLDKARTAAVNDDLLLQALERAPDGCVTQDLAGGPELVHRYNSLDPAARAVVTAAMDARRLGVGLHIPHDFLADAVEGYLTDAQYDLLPDNWFEQALADASQLVRGNLTALRRVRPRPSRRLGLADAPTPDSACPVYRLADYLEQHGRTTRRMQCPPESFWHAAWAHMDNHEDLGRLAEAALARYRLRWAFLLHQRSGCYRDLGVDCVSKLVVAQLTGTAAEAVVTWAAEEGETWAMLHLARVSWRDNDLETAEVYARRVADADDPEGLYYLGHIRGDAGDREGANELICQAADHGHEQALLLLADAFRAEGDMANEMDAVREAAEQGSLAGLGRFLTLLQEESNEEQFAQVGWQVAVACGLPGMLCYAGVRRDADHTSTPEDLVHRTVGWPGPVTLTRIAEEMYHRGDKTAADGFALEATAAGEAEAWGELVDLRLEAGDVAGAEIFARKSAAAGDTLALLLVAEAHEEAGNPAEAEALAQEAAAAGDTDGLLTLAEFRMNAGDAAGAEALALRAGHLGNTEALLWVAEQREKSGDNDGAEKYALQAADGGVFSNPSYSHITDGEWLPSQVAAQWPYGLDPDGTPSTAWHLSR
ncbi:helix-turn-helix domain-containing protein [Streptomyces caniscabiei]|uniref:helix-turn-helix domain-containing protein n=1 Tax=Streptomyces caniscabiei TaxID=2746961 RepID=UPI0038F5FA84